MTAAAEGEVGLGQAGVQIYPGLTVRVQNEPSRFKLQGCFQGGELQVRRADIKGSLQGGLQGGGAADRETGGGLEGALRYRQGREQFSPGS